MLLNYDMTLPHVLNVLSRKKDPKNYVNVKFLSFKFLFLDNAKVRNSNEQVVINNPFSIV